MMLLRRRNRSLQYGTIELQSGNGLPRTLKTEERFLTVSDEEFHELQRGDDLQLYKGQVEKSSVPIRWAPQGFTVDHHE